MREYTFRALITFVPAAREGAVRGYRDGTRIRCIVQPGRRKYLPAVISPGQTAPPRQAVPSTLGILLADDEAAAFFTPGRNFFVWADALVGDTIQGEGLLGCGVIAEATTQSRADACRPYTGTEAMPA